MKKWFILSYLIISSFSTLAFSHTVCPLLFSSADWAARAGAEFLLQKNRSLHVSPLVEKAAKRAKASQNPTKKVLAWLRYLEEIYGKIQKYPQAKNRIKDLFFEKYVIKPEQIPESFFQFQLRLARDQGHGDIVLDKSEKHRIADVIIRDQRASLDIWLDYFFSADTKAIPMWEKYWALTGMTKLSRYLPETESFGKREGSTTAPFVELNREALALVLDAILKKVNKQNIREIQSPELLELLVGANFGLMYAKILSSLKIKKRDDNNTEGEWRLFKRNTDPNLLVKALSGQNTGWCTAGIATAEWQLKAGDFHIYFSKDVKGIASVPRIAVRMEGEKIAEVRGTAEHQNIDQKIAQTPILSNKLKEFGNAGQEYQKKNQHMKWLSEIERKHKNKLPLNKDELTFLYEINEPIIGFGYDADPRAKEIIEQRAANLRSDLEIIFAEKYAAAEISLSKEEFLEGGKRLHWGDLYLSLDSADGYVSPIEVKGNVTLVFKNPRSDHVLILPQKVYGDLNIYGLSEAEELVLPQEISGNLMISYLRYAEKITFPKKIRNLTLYELSFDPSKVVLPEITGKLTINYYQYHVYKKYFDSLNVPINTGYGAQN